MRVRKRHKPEEIVATLRQVDVAASQGQSVAEAIRSIGVTEVAYYRGRQEYGGLKSDQVKCEQQPPHLLSNHRQMLTFDMMTVLSV